MALSDLSLVTNSLLNLLRYRLDVCLSRIETGTLLAIDQGLSLSSLPGDEMGTGVTLRLSLYHVTEDAYLKNQPPVSSGAVPVRNNPMGLQLYYQMTVHTDPMDDTAVAKSQKLFGLALKAFHDYPYWDQTTKSEVETFFGTLSVKPLSDTDDILRITLMHISPEQAEQFWSSSTKPVRLSAYYMVTAVLLEPEMPTEIPGRVLDYEIKDFIIGAPRLDASTNTIKFKQPDGIERKLDLRPAEVPVGGSVDILGSGLGGNGTSLQISSGNWDAPVDVGGWITAGTSDRITVTIGTTAGATPNIHNIVPGLYTAAARIPKGSAWQISNEVPFAVAPNVGPVVVDSTNPSILSVPGGVFQDANVSREHVQVLVGGQPVPIVATGVTPLSSGFFEITGPNEIRIQFPITGVAPSPPNVPLRIIVNDAESAPLWITVPA